MACRTFDCRCKSKKAECPRCGKVLHTSGDLISYHPPCKAVTIYDPPRKYKLDRTTALQEP